MIWILAAALIVLLIVQFARRNGGKEKTAQVRVASKQTRPHRQQGKDDDSLPTEQVVCFEAEGKTLELIVSRQTFETVREGERGTLTYKGDVFIDFEPENRRPW